MSTPRNKANGLKPYYLSKWICPTHGKFVARTTAPVNPDFPIHCPDCNAQFVEQLQGMTILPVPFVSKPSWPQTSNNQFTGQTAPLRKRKKIW